jgi:hypothetical protein
MSKFKNKILIPGGEAIAEAMRDLYTLYDDSMIDWFAALYCHEIGGYYYSNSGRDNEGFLPDIESTAQALRFIDQSGLKGDKKNFSEVIPEWMGKDIARYIKGLQDPNGFFYHPQWTREHTDSKLSRKARDLGNGLHVLSCLGYKPTYDTPSGEKGDGLDFYGNPIAKVQTVTSDGKVEERAPETAIPDNLKNKAAFLDYLDSLDIKNNSYSVGNTLTAQKRQIMYRDEVLRSEGADYSLCDILIKWLNDNQNKENGLWDETVNYHAVNGLMKITGVYGAFGVLMPNAETAVNKAIAAMGTDEIPNAVTCVYNTWFAAERVLRHMRTLGTEEDKINSAAVLERLRAKAPDYIRMTKDKLAVFRKPDSSFSYTPDASSANSQGCPVAIRGTNEGDVNATIICSSELLYYMYEALGIREYMIPMFGKADMDRYVSLLEKGRR